MNDLGDAHMRTWMLRFAALLAADTQDRLAWLGDRALETQDVVAEMELLCRVSEEVAERGVFAPEDLDDLRAISGRLGEFEATCRVGLWGSALATDPAWEGIRHKARLFLLTTLGTWHRPLSRPVRPYTSGQ